MLDNYGHYENASSSSTLPLMWLIRHHKLMNRDYNYILRTVQLLATNSVTSPSICHGKLVSEFLAAQTTIAKFNQGLFCPYIYFLPCNLSLPTIP